MLLLRNEFEMNHPEMERFGKIKEKYFDSFKNLMDKVEKKEETDEKQILSSAAEKAASDFKDWKTVIIEARKYHKSDLSKAKEIYEQGIEQFPESENLFVDYIYYLYSILKEYDKLDLLFSKALSLHPNNATTLGNYATYLKDIKKDYVEAEKYYKRSLEIEPEDAITLGNYATYLKNIKKDYTEAEKYYNRSIEIEPNNAFFLGKFAIYLHTAKKDYTEAEKYYKRSLEIEPNNAFFLGNYAQLLFIQGRLKEAVEYFSKAIEHAGESKTVLLECYFYGYAHLTKNRAMYLSKAKELLVQGERSTGWNLDDNVNRAIADGHREPELLKTLAEVISEEFDIKELEKYKSWNDA